MRLTNATPSPLETQRSLDVARGKLEKRQKAPTEDVRPAPAPIPDAAVSAIPVARTSPAVSKTEQALQSQLIDSQRINQIAPIANSREPRRTATVEAPPVAANSSNAPIETDARQATKAPAPATAPVATEKSQTNTAAEQSATSNNRAPPPAAGETTRREIAPDAANQATGNTTKNQGTVQGNIASPAQNTVTARADTNPPRANSNNRQQIASNTQPPAIEREYQEALRTPNTRQQETAPLREVTVARNQAPANQTHEDTDTSAQAPATNRSRTEPTLTTASVNNTRSTTQSTQAAQGSERQQNQGSNTTPEKTVPVETRAPINASQQAITQYQASQSLLQDATSTIRVRTTA